MYAPLPFEFVPFLAFTPLLLPLCLFDSAVRFGGCFNFYGVKDIWAFGLMFSAFHLFFGLGIAWARVIIFLPSQYSPFLCPWPLGHCSCHVIPPCLLWLCPPFASRFCHGLTVSPPSRKFFAQGFSDPLFTSLPLLGFVGQHSYCTSPFHYVILQASPTHILPLYLYYSYGLFTKSFGLPRPNYHIFTSYCYLGLLALRPAH